MLQLLFKYNSEAIHFKEGQRELFEIQLVLLVTEIFSWDTHRHYIVSI